MMQDFDQLPGSAKIWIYQAPKKLEREEIQYINSELNSFVSNWDSHGSRVKASFKIFNDLFIVLSVDELMTAASGCSIDKSVHVIEKIGQHLNIDLFNRTNIAYINNEEIVIEKLKTLKKLISNGSIDKNTVFFNNTITTKHELMEKWKIRANDSWLKPFFQASAKN